MLDSQIVNIFLRNFNKRMITMDIIQELEAFTHRDYHIILKRCNLLVDKGILKSYKKNNTIMYQLVNGL